MPRTDELIAQYESWAYPRPLSDLDAYRASGGHDLSDPSRIAAKLWPLRDAPQQLNILVAGCGSNQAAILAHANPSHRVTGIDLSEAALANHMMLKVRHKLENLSVQQLGVECVSSLGSQFDLIVCTGVLHHMSDPLAGLSALRQVLAPNGVISVMLYGKNRRAGVYMVQEALRTLGAQRDQDGVALARDVLAGLPAWHPARSYMDIAPDLGYDAGLVDTFLNARDRAYDVREVMALVASAGLGFQGWMDGIFYSPFAALPPDSAVHTHFHSLPKPEQWHVVDLLAQTTAAHRFLLGHPGHAQACTSLLDAEHWPSVVLHRHADLKEGTAANGALLVSRAGHAFTLPDGGICEAFKRIDGQRTASDLLSAIQDPDTALDASHLLLSLVEMDHLYCTAA